MTTLIKTTFVLYGLLPLVLIGCTQQSAPGEYQKYLQTNGYVGYFPPVGDPKNPEDWEKYGPGTILRAGKANNHYYEAKELIGKAGVQTAMDAKNASPINFFGGKQASGSDFDGRGGWTFDAVNQISGSLNLKSATEVDIQFGNTWKASPKGEGDWHQLLAKKARRLDSTSRNGLRNGQFVVVQNAIWTDSIRYYFKQNKEGGGSVNYKLTGQDIANLQAKGYRVIDGGIQVDQPRFIAFTPLPGAGNDVSATH